MLSVRVQKDIGEYTEKIVGKLSARTLVCLAGGLASAVGTAAICQFALGIEVRNAALPVMCASMPFWLAGFLVSVDIPSVLAGAMMQTRPCRSSSRARWIAVLYRHARRRSPSAAAG